MFTCKNNYYANNQSKAIPSSNSLGELKVSGHNCYSIGVNGAQIGVFEKRY